LIRYIQLFGLFVLLSVPFVYRLGFIEVLKLRTFDSLVSEKDSSGYFSILSINEEDIEREGGYPLSRQRLAEIHNELLERGAIGVGWVLSFPQPDRFGGDEEFSIALARSPSVLAMFENNNGDYPETIGTVILGEDVGGILASGVIQNIEPLKESASQGIAVARTDIDNLVRRLPLLMRTPDGWIPAYGTEVLKILAGADTYIIKTNANGIEEITVRGLPPVSVDSLGRRWISYVDTPETNLYEMDVLDKFVFVGFSAIGIVPQVATPHGLLEPHKIQAALAESILIENSPYIPNWSLAAEMLIFAVGVISTAILINIFGISLGITFTSLLFIGTGYLGIYLIQRGLLIDVTWALISEFIVASAAFYLRFREQYKLRLEIKKQFEHYLDPRQVKKLQKNPEILKLGGEKRFATYLFTDVRGFTSMSESLEPEKVTYIMNKALTAQQKAVQKHGGMVDKYIGDAMFAIFNSPLDLANHPNIAVDCALEIIRNMSDLADEFKAEELPPVAIGIGINTGYAVIGNMGSESRFDFTAIGDSVNIAARLESATKERKVDLLIGETTESLCRYSLKELEPIKVKGKEKALKIYTYE
jgi:adenylate cyclase